MMDRIIRQITDHFVSALPDGASHYFIEDLKKQDFPDFLVNRIHIELQRNLDESMMLPETDWANTRSEAVQRSWQQFLNAIHAEAKLPASYAQAVIETALADIVEMLTEPRKNITQILFGGEEVLTAAELNKRSELLVVYPHFAKVLTGYMQRKIRDEMSRGRCNKIVAQVDDKVTRRYTPLQWAQMLDPLFTLGSGRVNTNLIRLFFEDRQMHRTAGKFDAMDETITRAEFVEVLSEPELWDHEDYQEDQSGNSDDEESVDLKKHADLDDIGLVYENIGEIHKDQPSSDRPVTEDKKDRKTEREQEVNLGEEKAWEMKTELDGETGVDVDEIDDHKPEDPERSKPEEFEPSFKDKQENKKHGPEDFKPVIENRDSNNEEPEQPYSLNAFFAEPEDDEESEGGESESQPGMVYSPFAPDDETEQTNIAEEEENDAQPIWMRFRNQDDSKKETSEEIMPRFVEIEDEQGRWSENIARKSHEEQTVDADYQLKELKERLSEERGYFVDELFNGSAEAYQDSLEKIAKEHTWKKASKLIEQDIFRRNNVNIFSAVAVNFIDRLQSFFLEKQNRN
jgi:hypothetical protein